MRRIAAVLSIAGLVIWVLGVVAWSLGVWVTLPPDVARVLVLGLAALSGGVLVACGALVGRASSRSLRHAAEAHELAAPAPGAFAFDAAPPSATSSELRTGGSLDRAGPRR